MTRSRTLTATLVAGLLSLGLGLAAPAMADPVFPAGPDDFSTCADLGPDGQPQCDTPDDGGDDLDEGQPEVDPDPEPEPQPEADADPAPAPADDVIVADPTFTG